MVDIHCHIQPEVDDGPKSWETTLEMCNLANSVANKPALVEHNPRAIVAGQNLPYFPFLSIIVGLREVGMAEEAGILRRGTKTKQACPRTCLFREESIDRVPSGTRYCRQG
jgi:hypothetical protein